MSEMRANFKPAFFGFFKSAMRGTLGGGILEQPCRLVQGIFVVKKCRPIVPQSNQLSGRGVLRVSQGLTL